MIRVGLLALLAAGCISAEAPAPAAPLSAEDKAAQWGPIVPGAHFHHVHLNVKNREASITFYTRHFDAVRATFAGTEPAVWAQRSWLLFNEVTETPQPQQGTSIGHFGWGAPDAEAEFARQKSLGATFQTELSDISRGLGADGPGQFFFMYVRGPDGELIEINTDPDNNFGHIHMSSTDAIMTGAWYRNMFGLADAPPYFDHLVVQTGSGETSRQFFDNVNMIINRRENATFRPTRGSITDHIGISVPDLDSALTAVRAHRVKVLEEPKTASNGLWRSAFIEGPDRMVIELIEDRSEHPLITD